MFIYVCMFMYVCMGMWCSEKGYVRTHNNQDFGEFSQLIELSRSGGFPYGSIAPPN